MRIKPLVLAHQVQAAVQYVAVAWVVAAGMAHADSPQRVTPLPKYQQECVACHVAYPPGMLPAGSWKRIMGSLDKHFGTDASLDEASVREISGWLQTHAGTYKRVSEEPPQDRITPLAVVCAQTPRGGSTNLDAGRRQKRRQLRGVPHRRRQGQLPRI